MLKEKYENVYKNKNRFSFGKNWILFLNILNKNRINQAKRSLNEFLGGAKYIKGKRFIDIGCGSGLFSLAAYLLGAKEVTSVDVDQYSIDCVKYLRGNNCDKNTVWKIFTGSALDNSFIDSLNKFDIVYSWGVLHHTGDMYSAIGNVTGLVNKNGLLYIAIYNNNEKMFPEGSSKFWWEVKSIYNRSGSIIKKIIEIIYICIMLFGLLINGINPIKYIKNYSTLRGMNFYTDIKDWLGGFPYEYASIKEIKSIVEKHGFKLIKTKSARSIGCNEFLFRKISITSKKHS